MTTPLEQVEAISKDIVQKLSEVQEGSATHKFLLKRKKSIDDALEKIVKDNEKTKYDYELYSLYDKLELLKSKIEKRGYLAKEEDEEVKAYKEMKAQHNWILRTKATWY